MENGSSSSLKDKVDKQKGQNQKLVSVLPNIEPFVARKDYVPRELRSWAKRTGFVSSFSGETVTSTSVSDRDHNDKFGSATDEFDLEKGHKKNGSSSSPKIEIDPVLGRTRNRESEIEPDLGPGIGLDKKETDGVLRFRDGPLGSAKPNRRIGNEPNWGVRDSEMRIGVNGNGNKNGERNGSNGQGLQEPTNLVPLADTPVVEPKKDDGNVEREMGIDVQPDGEEPGRDGGWLRSSRLKCGPTENPGFAPLTYYGMQHYLSLSGSLIFIPLIIVPTMGGTDKDTATVISTMLLVSGVTTIMHSCFGTRLPLVQGSSFVYLAPALVIMNSREHRNLTQHKFRHIMMELQGAIIIGSIFQCILGFSGLMSLLLRLINPIVVAPTIAAVGLAFFSYGFPQAGNCVEISLPLILLVLIFTLYVRGIFVFGHRVFLIYAVPLSVVIIWVYAFFLTAGGAYNYKGCNPDIPSSNILIDACRRHAYTMRHCRTDVSNAWRTAEWVRIPYPLQWGIPVFRLRTSIIAIIVALVASVDSVGTYHSASLTINAKPPTPGIVSRGIGLEGFCSVLAGLWGTGTGSTTLTENVHTIDITKVANRRAVELGAFFLIFSSFIGKVGAILASIPQALAAAVLCFLWALIVALGLSKLQYCQTASFRNLTIVGVSLFLGLSIPAYVQQYQPKSSLILPSYLVPYAAASSGPIHTGNKQLDFAINALLSLNMVITFLVALVLDNTVPGSQQERGVYKWSSSEDILTDPSALSLYSLPSKFARFCHCPKWLRS